MMLKKKIVRFASIGATLTLLLAAGFAHAGEGDKPLPPVLEQLKDKGGTVDFLGHSYGVDGWRVVRDGNQDNAMYAYTTPEGGVLLGVLLQPDGTNETGLQIKALKQKLDGAQSAMPGAEKSVATSAKIEKLYAEIEKSAWVRMGDEQAPYIYIFINTLCEHCQNFWKDLAGPVKAGTLQVRLIPFGSIPENRLGAGALLSVDDPVSAWSAFIGGDKNALPKDKIKDGVLDRVDANTKLFRDWNLDTPPFAMYRKPSDGMLMAIKGKPENTMLVIADLMKADAVGK